MVEADEFRNLAGRGKRRGAPGDMQMRADRDVFQHREAGKRLDDLERARHALPRQPMCGHAGNIAAAVEDASAGRLLEAADQREQGGLARAVRPNHGGDTAGFDRERGLAHGP